MSLRQGVDITWKQRLFREFSGAFLKTARFCPLLRCTICKLRAHFDIPTLLRLVRKRFVLGRPFAALRGSLDRLSAFTCLVGHGTRSINSQIEESWRTCDNAAIGRPFNGRCTQHAFDLERCLLWLKVYQNGQDA